MGKKLPTLFFFVGILLSCISPLPAAEKKSSIAQTLSLIPEEDKLALDAFFRILIFKSPFGFVLYGDKPMSMVDYVSKCSDGFYGGIRYSDLSVTNAILKEGWRVWEKHHHLFPSKNYILHHFDRKNRNCMFILIINQKAFQDTFEKNHQEFIKNFGSAITSKEVLQKLLSKESLFAADFIQCHEIQGILFGFGKHNSKLFQKRENLEKLLKLHRSKVKLPSRRLLKEIEEINSTLQFFGDDNPSDLRLPSLPTFSADLTDNETIALKRKYEMQRRQIAEFYSKGNFLELTLMKLME